MITVPVITQWTTPATAYIITKKEWHLFLYENNATPTIIGETFLEFVEHEYGLLTRNKVEQHQKELISQAETR